MEPPTEETRLGKTAVRNSSQAFKHFKKIWENVTWASFDEADALLSLMRLASGVDEEETVDHRKSSISDGEKIKPSAKPPREPSHSPPRSKKPRLLPRSERAEVFRPSKPSSSSVDVGDDAVEDWVTWDPNPRVWKQYLEEEGVDDISIKELFLLGQLSDLGRQEANRIISKLLKKKADNVELRNPSAFVHSAVRSARHSLQ